jgi:hypothetical protein
MQTLAILILTAVLSQSSSPDRRKQEKPSDKKQDVTKSLPATPPVATPKDEKCACKETNSPAAETQRAPEKSSWGDLPTWLLVFVGGVAAWIAVETLKDIQKQTINATKAANAAEKSANAVLLSAQAQINAERAWIVAELVRVRTTNDYSLQVTNSGKTPAIITSFGFRCAGIPMFVQDLRDHLAEVGSKNIHLMLVTDKTEVLETFEMSHYMTEWWKEMHGGTKRGILEVWVKYLDILQGRFEHITRTVYSYEVSAAALVSLPEHNRYT